MNRRAMWAFLADVACIIVFVAIGRRSHEESRSVLEGIAKVSAPFLIALVVAWLVTRAWRTPLSLATATLLWLITVALGMVLRHTLFDRGTALAFIIVATLFTGALLAGWRAVFNRIHVTASDRLR